MVTALPTVDVPADPSTDGATGATRTRLSVVSPPTAHDTRTRHAGASGTRQDSAPQDTPTGVQPPEPASGPGEADAEEKGKNSQASRLVALALERYELINGDDGQPYAVSKSGPNVALPLRGKDGLRKQLARVYYETTGGVTPGGSALSDAMTVLDGKADEGPTVPIGLRVAPWRAGFVLDLGDQSGRAVLVQPGWWRLADGSPVIFRRSRLTLALPTPAAPGAGVAGLAGFRQLLNVDDTRFRLIVGWLVAALMPDIPHPILVLMGESGTAKTTAAWFAVQMVDPSTAPTRTPPPDLGEWAVQAAASWTLALDNLSTVAPWFSDTLCKAVTGDGIIKRVLFSDGDVYAMAFRRVLLITTIDAGALAGDLAERMIPIELQRIPDTNRRTEADVRGLFAASHPATLAALLDLAAGTLAELPTVRLTQYPRMADFARILAALDRVTGWTTLPDYLASTSETSRSVLDADPFATAILQLLAGQAVGWSGTATELLEAITPDHPPRGWPSSVNRVTGALRRISPNLRKAGYTVEHERRPGVRLIRLAPDPDSLSEGTEIDRHDRHTVITDP